MLVLRKLIIIDGHSEIYRAIFARGDRLTSPGGEPTRGTYFFIRMLISLVQTAKPHWVLVTLDSDRETLERRKLYEGYKAGRDDPPADVTVQLQRIIQLVKKLGLPTLQIDGHEADDVIASVVSKFRRKRIVQAIEVITADKDIHQVVGKKVTLYDPRSRDSVTVEDVKRRWGVGPKGVVEVQTLAGDSTDGVPGFAGIGITKAKKLIASYGTAAAAVENAEDQTPALCANLSKGDLSLSRALVELRTDLPIPFTLSQLRFRGLDFANARSIFKQLGFRRWST